MNTASNARVVVTYHYTDAVINREWDRGVNIKLNAAFGDKVVATGSGFDLSTRGRNLSFEIKPGTSTDAVRKIIRQFFKNRRATGVTIDVYKNEQN